MTAEGFDQVGRRALNPGAIVPAVQQSRKTELPGIFSAVIDPFRDFIEVIHFDEGGFVFDDVFPVKQPEPRKALNDD